MTTVRWAAALLISFLILSPFVNATNVNPLYKEKGSGGTNPLYQSSNFAVAPGAGGGAGSVDVAFVSDDVVYAKSGTGTTVITLTGSNFRTTPVGPISVSDGHVYFAGADAIGSNHGVFAAPLSGNIPITVRGSAFSPPNASYAPVISRGVDTRLLFQAHDDAAGETNLYAATRSGGVYLTIRGTDFAPNASRGINHWGDRVEASVDASSGASALFVTPGSGGIRGTIPVDPSFRVAGSPPRILDNDARSVVFTAVDPATGTLSLFHSDKFVPQGSSYGPPTLISSGIAPGSAVSVAELGSGVIGYLSKKSYDYYSALSDRTAAGGLEAITETRLIGAGDVVDGLTVADVVGSESSLLPNGDAVLLLSFTDGSAGLYYVQVPEPGTVALVLGPAILFVMRRRRR